MDDRLLTQDEIREMTGGLTQGAAQTRFLRKHGIRVIPGIDGKPKVWLSWLKREQNSPQNNSNEPNFGALRGSQAHQRH
jgi:hypothetical protein